MLTVNQQPEPATPPTWVCYIFLDTLDNLLKVKKDTWVVEVLEQLDLNTIKLDSQNFQWWVNLNDPVYFDAWAWLWTKATSSTQSPSWLRWPINSVILWWYYTVSWFTAWEDYFLNPVWGLTTTPNNTKIWHAFSTTLFYVDIDIEWSWVITI